VPTSKIKRLRFMPKPLFYFLLPFCCQKFQKWYFPNIDHLILSKSDVQGRITQGVGKCLNVYKCRVSSFSN